MSDETCEWLVAYTKGKALEQSRDRFNWFPLDHEPTIGDGWFYREIPMPEPVEEPKDH